MYCLLTAVVIARSVRRSTRQTANSCSLCSSPVFSRMHQELRYFTASGRVFAPAASFSRCLPSFGRSARRVFPPQLTDAFSAWSTWKLTGLHVRADMTDCLGHGRRIVEWACHSADKETVWDTSADASEWTQNICQTFFTNTRSASYLSSMKAGRLDVVICQNLAVSVVCLHAWRLSKW